MPRCSVALRATLHGLQLLLKPAKPRIGEFGLADSIPHGLESIHLHQADKALLPLFRGQ